MFGLIKTFTSVLWDRAEGRVRIYGEFLFGNFFETIEGVLREIFKALVGKRRRRQRRLQQHRHRRLGFFKKLGNGLKKAWNGVKAYGKHVKKQFKKAGKQFREGIDEIKNKNIAGGLKKFGQAAVTAATALIPVDIILHKISYDLDLQEAKRDYFKVSVDFEVKVLETKKRFKKSLTINLSKPANVARALFKDIKGAFSGLIKKS